MPHNVFHLPEDRILAEQLRLMFVNVASSLLPASAMVIIVAWALSTSSTWHLFAIWGMAVIVLKLISVFHAKRALASGISSVYLLGLVRQALVLGAVSGVTWGVLAWIALDTNSVVNSVLVVAILAGVGANSMSIYSAVFPVFLSYVVLVLVPLELALWVSGGPDFLLLIFCIAVYVTVLVMYAKNNASATRAAIDLRFENIGLIERLRVETTKAEEANLAKSKFLAAASHDLRQPIHALGMLLDAISRGDLSQSQRQKLEKAIVVSEATSEILNTLLDFSRIEAGVISPQIRSFRLQPLLNKIESELAPQADEKGLFYRTRETYLAVSTDPVLIKLILRNLVSNAIRYTKTGGILVACRTRGNNALLEVWDTGIGIDPLQQQEVFREFHQLGNPERDHRNGLGLGLSIVDRLARQLGHRLTLTSVPNRGSLFRISLPIAHDAVAINDFETPQINMRNLNIRVLVIDDEEAVRTSMHLLLQNWGCECVAVESIEEAVAAAGKLPPDLIISDYRLREHRTGAEAIAAVRSECGWNLPAILITGDTAPERLREAIASGIPLLHKPVSPTQLNRRLLDLLAESSG